MAILGTLTAWKIKRVGGLMTITHSTGKVTGVRRVFYSAPSTILAETKNGGQYQLSVT